MRDTDKIKPSKEIWQYFKGDITVDAVLSAIADKIAGYRISYSATELLKDLDYLTKNGKINKKGVLILSHQLHDRFHHKKDGVQVINPFIIEESK